jgi:hypothetical protein
MLVFGEPCRLMDIVQANSFLVIDPNAALFEEHNFHFRHYDINLS